MMDDLDNLQRVLEQATAAGDHRADGEMDPQTAKLHEAWVTFGQLLDAASPATEQSLHWLTMPPSTRSYRRLAVRLGALAVALLIGIGAFSVLRTESRSIGPAAQQKAAVAAVAKGSPVAAKHSASAETTKPLTPATSNIPWDDPLDSQLAEVGQDVVRVQESWSAATRSVDLVQYGAAQAQQEVEKSSL